MESQKFSNCKSHHQLSSMEEDAIEEDKDGIEEEKSLLGSWIDKRQKSQINHKELLKDGAWMLIGGRTRMG